MDTHALKRRLPVALAVLAGVLFVGWRLSANAWDVIALADIRQGVNSPGYDGQFAYFIALDPRPEKVRDHLDVPAYRYQRILYPLVARLLALGNADWIPWTLVIVNLIAHALGTWAVARLLGVHAGFAVTYGLWVGLIAPVGADLTEPLAYALVASGWMARREGRTRWSAGLLCLALFAKETTGIFLVAFLLNDLVVERRSESALPLAAGLGIFALFQLWLLIQFGEAGLGSGGALSTPFELLPFFGLIRIGEASLPALGLYLLIFGPTIVLPALWAVAQGIRQWRRDKISEHGLTLALNGAAIAFLPFSTFREPLGLVRFADGLILATLVYAAREDKLKPLRYSVFWIALLAMLVRQ